MSFESQFNIRIDILKKGEKMKSEQQEGEITKEFTREKINEAMKMISKIIKHESPHLAVFAGDSSLRFIPSREAPSFSFLPETYEVVVPVQWFLEKDYSPDEICWALFHELAHFIDMRENPEAFLDNFKYMRQKIAPQIAGWLEEELRRQGVPEEKIGALTKQLPIKGRKYENISQLEKIGYNMIHTFYNIFDDIYVNSLVAQKAPLYAIEAGRKKVERIYREKLGFGNGDFRGKPRHIQFVYSLMREEMLANDEPSKLDPEIEKIIQKKILGKNIKTIIEEKLKPKGGKLINPQERYVLLRSLLEPIYLDLVKKDITEMNFDDLKQEIEKMMEKTQSSGNQGESKDDNEAQGENQSEDKNQEKNQNKEQGKNGDSKKDEEQRDEQAGGEGGSKDNKKNKNQDQNDGQGEDKRKSEEENNGDDKQGDKNRKEDENYKNAKEDSKEKNKNQNDKSSSETKESQEKSGSEGNRDQDIDDKQKQEFKSEGPQAGGGFNFSDINEYHQNEDNPDNALSEKEIEKILKKFKEDSEYAKLSPEERAKKDYEKLKKAFDKKHNINKKTREIYDKISAKIIPYRKEMRQFWKKLIGKGMELLRKKKSKQKRGSSINVDDFIRELPDIQEKIRSRKTVKPKIYERFISEMVPGNQPERIEISIVADMSASMDKRKIKALQEAIALLLLSLKDFNDYLDQVRKKTKTKLVADSEVYVFGTSFYKAKQFDKDLRRQGKNREAAIIKAFDYLQNTIGTTNDAAVLSDILSKVNFEVEQKIKKGKLKKIVFEITDGVPDNINETKERIDKLLDKGVLVIGFKVGENERERVIFDEIWNKEREEKLGIYLGDKIEKLPQELLKVLKIKLKNVRI